MSIYNTGSELEHEHTEDSAAKATQMHLETVRSLLQAADALDVWAEQNPRYAKATREAAEAYRRQAREALNLPIQREQEDECH